MLDCLSASFFLLLPLFLVYFFMVLGLHSISLFLVPVSSLYPHHPLIFPFLSSVSVSYSSLGPFLDSAWHLWLKSYRQWVKMDATFWHQVPEEYDETLLSLPLPQCSLCVSLLLCHYFLALFNCDPVLWCWSWEVPQVEALGSSRWVVSATTPNRKRTLSRCENS